MHALLVGRFHAVTRAQAAWLESLKNEALDGITCVVTSADQHGTRRNPLSVEVREAMLRPALARAGKPVALVRVKDVPDSARWVEHLVDEVKRASGRVLSPSKTTVFSSNRDVEALFKARGFEVVAAKVEGLTPHELVQRVVQGRPWEDEASPETLETFRRPEVVARLKAIFSQALVNDDGELGHLRDFASYGAQMDASLRQKLDDLVRWVKPGCIVDKGCGTGMLLVELSRLFPASRLVGVDLSREFLRRCDENTYASQDVSLVAGNVIEQNVAKGSASTVIYSSVMHEVHSYSGYKRSEIDRALSNAFAELGPGGRVLVRDGVSPKPAQWTMRLLTPAAQSAFERFAREFKHGEGAPHERVEPHVVRLSSHFANEFICKKDYLKNWHIEVHEEYGPYTLDEWRQALARAGFTPLHLQGVSNPWIIENRYQGQVSLSDDDDVHVEWPATNCVVVGEKPLL